MRIPSFEENDPFTLIGYIFDKRNAMICSDCPAALVETIEEAKKERTIYSKEAGCCSLCAEKDGCFDFEYDIEYNGKYPNNFILKEASLSIMRRFEVKIGLARLVRQRKSTYSFDNKYGFFDPDRHRCNLPRKDRSIVCSKFFCSHINSTLTSFEKEFIDRQVYRMATLLQMELGLYK